jgi:hypothetical protein
LIQSVKGVSSHLANHEYQLEPPLKWQGGYGALSVSPKFVERVRQYILDQQEHHSQKNEISALERTESDEPGS